MSDKKIASEEAKAFILKIKKLVSEFVKSGAPSPESVAALGDLGAAILIGALQEAAVYGKMQDGVKWEVLMQRTTLALEYVLNKKLNRVMPGIDLSIQFLPVPYDRTIEKNQDENLDALIDGVPTKESNS